MVEGKTPAASRHPDLHRLEDIAGTLAGDIGLEIVTVTYGREPGGWVLSVTIDGPTGVNVEDCARMSQHLTAGLDELGVLSGECRLEVCSPGVERALVRPADFDRFAGQRVEIKTTRSVAGRKRFRGVLVGLSEDFVVVECDGDRLEIALDEISSARLRPEFKL